MLSAFLFRRPLVVEGFVDWKWYFLEMVIKPIFYADRQIVFGCWIV